VDYRRSAERVATSLLALIDFGDSSSTCLVTDMSNGGARLRVSPSKPLPARFQLRLSRAGTTHFVDLRWRSGEEAGVKFRAADLLRLPQRPSWRTRNNTRGRPT
jgi:PilZ domain